jgi:hypothetical protein
VVVLRARIERKGVSGLTADTVTHLVTCPPPAPHPKLRQGAGPSVAHSKGENPCPSTAMP